MPVALKLVCLLQFVPSTNILAIIEICRNVLLTISLEHLCASSNMERVPLVLSRTAFFNGSSNLMVAAQWYTIWTSSDSSALSSSEIPRSGWEQSPDMTCILSKILLPCIFFSKLKTCKKYQALQRIHHKLNIQRTNSLKRVSSEGK